MLPCSQAGAAVCLVWCPCVFCHVSADIPAKKRALVAGPCILWVLAHESPGLQLAFLLPARTPAVRRVASSFASRKFLSVCVSASVACTEHANGFLQSSVACKYCCVSSFCCQSQQPGTLPGIAPGVVPFASEAKQTTLGICWKRFSSLWCFLEAKCCCSDSAFNRRAVLHAKQASGLPFMCSALDASSQSLYTALQQHHVCWAGMHAKSGVLVSRECIMYKAGQPTLFALTTTETHPPHLTHLTQ